MLNIVISKERFETAEKRCNRKFTPLHLTTICSVVRDWLSERGRLSIVYFSAILKRLILELLEHQKLGI